MTKNNTKGNPASTKVAKVSSQIKAVTAEAEKKSTAIKVNTNKSNKPAKPEAKSGSAVKVNIQKIPAKSKTASSSTKANQNKRILNVVELGNDDQPVAAAANNKAIDGMVKPKSVAEPQAKEEKSGTADSRENPTAAERPQKSSKPAKKSKKSKKKITLIVLSIVLVVGAIAGVAVWAITQNNRNMCTVAFESNGGSEVEDIEVVCGSKVDQPDDPEKEGFEFREWAYRGKKFDFDDTTVDEDIILVAKWDASDDTETVTISFDSAGGSEVEDLVIKAGTATMAPADPVREGYTFDGWYLDDEKFDFSQPIDEDVILVARWSGGASTTPANNGNNSRPNSGSSSNNSGSTTSQPPANSSNSGSTGGSNTGGDNNSGSGNNGGNSGNTGGNGSGGDNTDPVTPGGDDNSNVPNPDSTTQP